MISGIPSDFESKEAFCDTTEGPVLTYTPHSSPLQLAFYNADAFPEEYRGDAFQVMRGSWNANPPAGYEIARIDFEDGEPVSFEPFITGWLVEEGDGHGQFARLAGLAVTAGGALLVADDQNGIVYRVRYVGESNRFIRVWVVWTMAPGIPHAPLAITVLSVHSKS